MGDKREQQDRPDRSDDGGMPDEELNPSSGAGYGNNAEEDGAGGED
jgi:hypothetical protein